MVDTGGSRPLHLQTIESLFAELISGASVSVSETETEFRFENIDSRALLNWYRKNQAKWAGNVMATDVEAMVTDITATPPVLPIPPVVVAKSNRRLRLVKVIAHRFAGVHAYGTAENAPPDFVLEPHAPITLFEGWNGAGKTSLINTILWCLTGELLRPQRTPESAQQEFASSFVRSKDNSDDEITTHTLTPITPLPNPSIYLPPVNGPVPIDSWVELTFSDPEGTLIPVRRTQLRTPRGKITETQSGFDKLDVDPIALRIGTIMPALLQFLRIGDASDLGLAAARLTGLADLSSLARHASKACDRLSGEFRNLREREIEDADKLFLEARNDLQKQIDDFPEMAPAEPLPHPSDAPDLEETLTSLEAHFSGLKTEALAAARTILGSGFDPSDKGARSNLEASIGPAIGQLKSMAQLPSVRRARGLSELGSADWEVVDGLVTQLHTEATALAELSTTPDLAKRKQLYARIASWLREYDDHDVSSCVICSRSLDGIRDPVTQRTVSEHLEAVSESDQKLLSLTLEVWVDGWVGRLATRCPPQLQAELSQDLPRHPRDLIRTALVDDLFGTDAFSATLASLRDGMRLTCDKYLTRLPAFHEPEIEALPQELAEVTKPLAAPLRRLARARAFVQWRGAHIKEVTAETKAIIYGTEDEAPDTIDNLTPIHRKLDALSSIVKGVAPLNAALELCQRLSNHLKTRRLKEERLKLYSRAVLALGSIVELGSLAQRQVETLRELLHTRSQYWRDRCYHNSFPMAGHSVRSTSMNVRGVLDIAVGFENATAPAQHISNSSALRATLMGFFLAFWEHVLTERGGIALMVLDDPQELLDHDNKERLARLFPELVQRGGQLVVSTYDRHFARAMAAAGREHAAIEHRSVHPVNPLRLRLETAQAIEELDCKRNLYEQDKDNASRAQEYANEVRIFLEARLADLFDDPAYPAYSGPSKAPTLIDYLGHLRHLVNNPPNALFRGKAVADFSQSKALSSDAECMRVLNKSHHNRGALSAGDVFAVSNDLNAVRKLAERMHTEFRHWRWHEPLEAAAPPTNVVPFKPVSIRPLKVSIYPDLAAFTSNSTPEASQEVALGSVDETWFADKSLFLIRTDNFGFALPAGCIAIAESTSYDGKDHNLVVARQHGHLLARRLFRPAKADELALAAEAPDPRISKPTLFFDVDSIVLHRVVGMLTEQPPPPPSGGEATLLHSAASLSQIAAAYRVREESAIPLALPGQVVLGGDLIARDALKMHEGTLVALSLDDGSNVFKRIGKRVPGSNKQLWQFESVGGLGTSMIVSLAEPEERSDAPRFLSARRIVGVLYTM